MPSRASLVRFAAPLLAALPLVACAPVDNAPPVADDDSTAGNRTLWFTLRADTRHCAAPGCGGYYVTEINRATTVCGNGSRERQCYVASLDWTPSGLPAAQVTATTAAIGSDATQVQVVFQGSLTAPTHDNAYSTFRVAQAWRAPAAGPLTGDVYDVGQHGSSCTFEPCEDVKLVALNGTAVTTVTGVDVSAVHSDDVTHDAALSASTTDEGLVATGSVVQVPGNPATETIPAFSATQFFTRVVRTAGRSCSATIQPIFTTAVNELLYTSESDAPFTFFSRAGAGNLADTPAAFLTLIGKPANTPIASQSLDDFFGFNYDDESLSLAERARAARFRQLQRLIPSQLTDIHVYRVGEIQIDVYIVGRDHCGNLVGYQTLSIET